MQRKIILVATFVEPEQLDLFFDKLKDKFGINPNSVFIFELDDKSLMLTYKLYLQIGEKINLRKELNKTIQVHKKGTTFFTINSLNRLIERDFDLKGGNIDYNNYKVDWDSYVDSMISLKNDKLEILSLKKKNID